MIAHLRRICEHLSSESDVENAIQLVALNACYSGSSSRIFIGQLYQDLNVTTLASFGFEGSKEAISAYETKLIPRLLEKVIQENTIRIIEHDATYQRMHKDLVGSDEIPIWKSTVLIPLLPNYFATLSIQVKAKVSSENNDYFNALRAILQLYLNTKGRTLQLLNDARKPTKDEVAGVKLTERQELILVLIEDGHTNLAIAEKLGYSESLIRQESIAIYRKLGILGRRDLKINDKQ